MITLILKLLLAHFVGDFALQPKKWIKGKENKIVKSPYLYYHVLVHIALLLLVLEFDFHFWPIFLTIGLTHFLIDFGKLSLQRKFDRTKLFFLDQALHILVILILVLYYYPLSNINFGLNSKNVLATVLALVILISVVPIFIANLTSRWKLEDIEQASSLKSAGKWIGILERLFIFMFVIAGQFSAIGFLLAAKSVFRFGDLSRAKDRKLTEYVLIGTLLSFLMAMITSFLYTMALDYHL